MSVAFVLAVLLAVCALYFMLIYPYFLSPLRKVPGPSSNPLFGQLPELLRNEPGIPMREWVKKYGSAVRHVGPLGAERLLFVKPEALSRILTSGWMEYPRPAYLRKILGLVAGYGLLTVTGNEHKQMRKTMNQAFSLPNLMAQTDMYYDPINGLVEIMAKEIDAEPENGKQFIMFDWLGKVTLDIIALTAFGYKTDCLHDPHNELAQAYEQLAGLQSGYNMAKLVAFMLLPFGSKILTSEFLWKHRKFLSSRWVFGGFFAAGAKLMESMRIINRLSSEMLAQKMRELLPEFEAIHPNDMELAGKKDVMSLLVRARAEYEKQQQEKKEGAESEAAGYGMNQQAMLDQVLTFLSAGHETTSSGLAWSLYLLATHPEVQRQLREEVSQVFTHNARPDYRTLKDLKWLDCVVMESLRLFPPVPYTVRIAETTDYIDGVLVPKGTMIQIAIRAVNTWKETWGEDAEEFNPSRWLNLPKDFNPAYSFLSFIAGPHACIGKTMAIVEMKAVLGALVTNFSFELAYPGQTARPSAAITMKPADGMPLRVKRVVRS